MMLRLTPDCSPKLLEEPCVYSRATDELYIVNREAVDFLAACAGGAPQPDGPDAAEFVRFCIDEGILEPVGDAYGPAGERQLRLAQSPIPSLRYLLLHITDRCNLRCRHCFIGESGSTDLPLARIRAIVDEFEGMQGLRLLVSGGEPLLHREFRELNDYLAQKDLRTVLLSNGTLIDPETAASLRFKEVQVSLDGMREAHDFIRGEGNFERSVGAIRNLRQAGMDVSVATMVHSHNLGDFDELGRLVRDLGAGEWAVDAPSAAGRLEAEGRHGAPGLDQEAGAGLIVSPDIAGPLLGLSFGGAIHEPAPGYACGAHLMAVMADGRAARCGFYAGEPVGSIGEGLAACWQKVSKLPLAELECDCELIEDCRGGCRFRAAGYNSPMGPDLCQCYRYGIVPGS